MDGVIEKLKKLLRLGKSSNCHEAALAMQRAFELAEKNNIDLGQVNRNEPKICSERKSSPRRVSYEQKLAIAIAEMYFRVRVISDYDEFIFIGESAHIEIAEYVITFMVRECRRHAKDYGRGGNRKRLFITGFFAAIHAQLLTFMKRSGLNRIDHEAALDKYKGENFTTESSKIGRPINVNTKSFRDGARIGRSIQIVPAAHEGERALRRSISCRN